VQGNIAQGQFYPSGQSVLFSITVRKVPDYAGVEAGIPTTFQQVGDFISWTMTCFKPRCFLLDNSKLHQTHRAGVLCVTR
jgi:hypothetical protein